MVFFRVANYLWDSVEQMHSDVKHEKYQSSICKNYDSKRDNRARKFGEIEALGLCAHKNVYRLCVQRRWRRLHTQMALGNFN